MKQDSPVMERMVKAERAPTRTTGLVSHSRQSHCSIRICLLTGGDDRPYAFGMVDALVGQGIPLDFISSDKLEAPERHTSPLIRSLNLRGDMNEDAHPARKAMRILLYYLRLFAYVPRSPA